MGWKQRFIRVGFVLTFIAAIIMAASIFGFRSGFWNFQGAFGGIGVGVLVALTAVLLSLVGLIWSLVSRSGFVVPLVGLILGGALAGFPISQIANAFSGKYPPIHDITTDTDNPPVFVDIVPLRGDTANSIDYSSKRIPDQEQFGPLAGKAYPEVQQQFYPQVQTLALSADMNTAFDAAVASANELGWEIVAKAEDQGRLEATATSALMGFKDDVIVRLTQGVSNQGSTVTLIDVRSSSRVGLSDLGANAQRVELFLEEVERSLATK